MVCDIFDFVLLRLINLREYDQKLNESSNILLLINYIFYNVHLINV
jgi:hypothetical protein